MKVTIILLNGPPKCGKDTVAKMIKESTRGKVTTSIRKFTKLMDEISKLVLNLNTSEYHEWRELKKDEQLMQFKNTTMRKFLIGMSEDFLKPHLGVGIMGYHAAIGVIEEVLKHTRHSDNDLVFVFSDSGFQEEYELFKKTLSLAELSNVQFTTKVVQIHRQGCDFTNDSREWIEDEDGHEVILNNGSLEDLMLLTDLLIRYVGLEG